MKSSRRNRIFGWTWIVIGCGNLTTMALTGEALYALVAAIAFIASVLFFISARISAKT